MSAFSTPQHAQIFFGYISLFCPNLEDLFIDGTEGLEASEMSPGAELEPGLCLLTRLRFLSVLKVGKAWRPMSRYNSGRPQACQMPEDEDDEDGGEELIGWFLRGSETRVEDEADTKLKEALKDLGKFMDVKNTIEGMDAAEGFVCWPGIRRVVIFSEDPFGLSVEKEYQRIISRQ
ncbi:hypothetical protein BGX30_008841 [Mortierella sp. GBA39]|nr:hypothetical protein BGX30_008841 [Mortierella sp. GBA39]